MESVLPTTPFGRRSLALAHIATQMAAKQRPPEAAANKWLCSKTFAWPNSGWAYPTDH